MNNRIRLLLLKALHDNADITTLVKAGYQYAEIAEEYSKLINDKMIIIDDNMEFTISDKGECELKRLEDERKNGDWKIEPYASYKIDKMSKFDVYIE